MTIGSEIKKARISKGLSVVSLADASGVSEVLIIAAEKNNYPIRFEVFNLAKHLGLDLDWVRQSIVTEAINRNKHLRQG